MLVFGNSGPLNNYENMKRAFIHLTGLFFSGLIFFNTADANAVFSNSGVQTIEYPPGTVSIIAYSEASMGYDDRVFYCLRAQATLYKNGTQVDDQEDAPTCYYFVGATTPTAYAEIVFPDDGQSAEYIVDGNFYISLEYDGGDGDYYNYQGYLEPPYIFADSSFAFNGPGPARPPNYTSILLGTVYDIFQRGNPSQFPGRCGDARDLIKTEYVTHQVNLYPACADFTQTRQGEYFTFNELNTGDYNWALIRDPLIVPFGSDGLNRWRVLYGSDIGNLDAGRICNSCYRNPVRNYYVGGARNSRHMYGDAADLRNESGTEVEWLIMEDTADRAGADFIEPRNQSGIGHVHADWRNHGGDYR